MTWSRLITGSIRFKNWIPIDERDKIISSFANLLEIEIIPANAISGGLGLRYTEKIGQWQFTDLNWQSNVEPKDIEAFYDTYREKFAQFEYDFYYISEPDKSFHQREVIETKLTHEIEKEIGHKKED